MALAALRSVPGFDLVVARTFGRLNEWTSLHRIRRTSVRVDAESHPRLFRLYSEVLERLDAPEAWPLHVVEMSVVNAATMGMEEPFITIADKALAQLTDEQIQVILAHEVGHILSGHMLYKTMLRVGIYLGWAALSFPVSAPLIAAVMAGLLEWDRKSELSADRASLLGVQDIEAVRSTLQQVKERHDEAMGEGEERLGLSGEAWARLQGFVRVMAELVSRHPPIEQRVAELEEWMAEGGYARVIEGDYPRRSDEEPDSNAQNWETLRAQAEVLREGLGEVTEPALEWLSEARAGAGRQARQLAEWWRKRR